MGISDVLRTVKGEAKGDLGTAVDKFLAKWNAPQGVEKGFHPSSICGGYCRRGLVLSRLYAPTDIDPPDSSLLRIFTMGHAVHNQWESLYEKMEIVVGREVAFEDNDTGITGRADLVIRREGKLDLIDIKSTGTKRFFGLRDADNVSKVQVGIYWWEFNKLNTFGRAIDRAFIEYVEKQFGYQKDFQVHWKDVEAKVLVIVKDMTYLDGLVKKGIVPEEKDCKNMEMAVKNKCPWRSRCFGVI